MTFKEFSGWCNERACDGYWGMNTAIICAGIIREVNKIPFWKRKKVWDKEYRETAEEIVKVVNEKIEQIIGKVE